MISFNNEINTKKNLHIPSMIILFSIIIISFFLNDSLDLKIPKIFFLSIYLIGFIILDRMRIVYFFIFLVPLSNGFLLYYLNVIFGIAFIVKNFKSIKVNRAVGTGIILILWESFHLLPNSFYGYNESIFKFLGFALCLIVITLVISNKNLSNNYVSLIYSWSIGLASLCSILLLKYLFQYGLNFVSIVRRFGWISTSLDSSNINLLINPNELAQLIILTIFCLLSVLKYEKKHNIKIGILISYLILFAIMTGSRSGLLIFFVLSFIYMLIIILKPKENIKIALVMIITLIAISIFSIKYMDTILNMFLQRLQNNNISGSRFVIYSQYIDILKNSFYLIFGSGMQDYKEKYKLLSSTHNVFIEIISIWGIIGLPIVFIWFINLYKSLKLVNNKHMYKKTILGYVPLLGVFLFAQTGQFFISYYNTLPTLIIAFMNIKYVYLKENNKLCNIKENV